MPLIDPRQDPRLVPIPNPTYPGESPPPEPGPAVPPVGLAIGDIRQTQPPDPGPVLGPIQPPPEDTGWIQSVLNVLEAPRNFAFSGAEGGYKGFRQRYIDSIDDTSRPLLSQYSPSNLAWKGIGAVAGRGGQETAADILLDPLNWVLNRGALTAVGEGVAAPVAKMSAPTADKILRTFALGDRYLNDVAELPFKGAIKATKAAVTLPAKIPGTALGMKIIGENGPEAASSLYDWATHQSPQTALHMVERQLQNIAGQLRSKGNTLELGLADWMGRGGQAEWPGNITDAARMLRNAQDEFSNHVVQSVTANPQIQPFADAIVHQIDSFRTILNGRYRTLQTELARRGASPAEAAAEQLQFQREAWQSLSDMIAGSRDVFDDLTRQFHGPLDATRALPPEQMATISRNVQRRMEQLKFLQHDLPGFMSDLPNQFRSEGGSWYESLLNRSMHDFQARYKDLNRHLRDFDSALRYVWKAARPTEDFPVLAPKDPADRMRQINGVLQQLGIEPADGAATLYQRLAPHLPVTQANKLKDALEFWSSDFLQGDLFDTVTGRVVREHAKNLGIDKPNLLQRAASNTMQFWKTQAIDSPAYLLSNLMGGLFMGALRGVEPMSVMRGLTENIGRAWRGGHVEISPLSRINETLDIVTPHEVSAGSGAAFLNNSDDVKAMLGKAQNIMERIGTPRLAAAGAVQGAYSGYTDTPSDKPEDRAGNMAQGAAVGAVGWGSLSVTSKYLLTRLGTGLEAVMRQAAYAKALTNGVEQRSGQLISLAQNALTAPRAGAAPGAAAVPAMQTAIEELQQRGGFISPAALEDWLTLKGVDPDVARRTGAAWRDQIQGAVNEGTRFAAQIHFDYEDLNNVQQLAKNFSPFATWGMKAYPFFLEELAKHPLVSLNLLRMTLDQEQERREGRMTGRFAGATHVPALDAFWSGITGKPQKVYLNPTRGLFPFSDVAELGAITGEETPVEQGLKGASALGFSIRPDLEAGLRLTPLTSGSAPASGFWRHSAPIQGLTSSLGLVNGRGVNLDAPTLDIERALRIAFRGLEPTDVTEANVLRRLDEMAIRETGKPISSGDTKTVPYLEARYLRQGGLWDRAWTEVAREAAGRSLYGSLTQIGAPRALLGEEEERIRSAQAQRAMQDPKVAQTIREAMQSGGAQKMLPELVPAMTKAVQNIRARYGESSLPEEVHQILMIPTAANLDQLRKWINEAEEQTNPLALGYSSGGSPEEVRLSNALTAYYSLPFLLRQDPNYKNMTPDQQAEFEKMLAFSGQAAGSKINPSGRFGASDPMLSQYARYATTRKDQMLAQEPMLAAYLRWQQSQNGYGNPRQFVREVWGNEARRRQFTQAQEAAPGPGR